MNRKTGFVGILVASGAVIIAIAIWITLELMPALDSCSDSGGKWHWWSNQCVCGPDYALNDAEIRCQSTLTREIRESIVIVRGQCKRIVSTFQNDIGAYGNKLEIDISKVLTGYGTQVADRSEYVYYGAAAAAGVCTGNDIIIILQSDFGGQGEYRFSRATWFPVTQLLGSTEEFVTVDDPVGFSLYSHKDGRAYIPDWTMVPYEDFVYTLRKISERNS